MNEETVLQALTFLRMACPNQKFDPESFKVWIRLLRDVPGSLEDAEEAVTRILERPLQPGRSRDVEPRDLIAELKAIRADRIERNPLVDADQLGPDDRYRPELVAYLQGLADGGRGLALISERPVAELPPADDDQPSEASVQARAKAHGGDVDFVRERDLAMTVRCRRCQVGPGQVCVNPADLRPLVRSTAHLERLEDVGLADRSDRPSLEEQKALILKAAASSESLDPPGGP